MIAGGRKDNPRFEVAPTYQSHFHGGIYDERGAKVTGCEVRFPVQEGSSTVSSGANTDIALFTAEEPGIYLACCAMEWQGNSSGQRKIALMDSGGTAYAFARQHSGSSGAMEQCASAIIPLNAGESILLRAWQNSGSALAVKNRSCQIARIGG